MRERPLWLCVLVVAGCFIKPSPPTERHDDASVDAGTPANTVFVTSMAVEFGTGIDHLDNTCNTLAKDADLPGTYVAWFSTQGSDAYTRLGSSARGWVRPDGAPFADTVDSLRAGAIYYPPRIDETGHDQGPDVAVATGTTGSGTDQSGMDCVDDTAPNGAVEFGFAGAGSPAWTQLGGESCTSSLHLYCFGIDHAVPVTRPTTTGPLVFVSAATAVPNPAGAAAFDQACSDDALQQNLTGTFVAVVATDTTSIAEKLSTPAGPWVRLDGVPTTRDFASFDAPIDVGVASDYRLGGVVWTGAGSATALGSGSDCGNWEQDNGNLMGIEGDVQFGDSNAINAIENACTNVPDNVYCAQTP